MLSPRKISKKKKKLLSSRADTDAGPSDHVKAGQFKEELEGDLIRRARALVKFVQPLYNSQKVCDCSGPGSFGRALTGCGVMSSACKQAVVSSDCAEAIAMVKEWETLVKSRAEL